MKALPARLLADDPRATFADKLAAEIRRVDGDHSLGAGALADALTPFIEREAAAALSGRDTTPQPGGGVVVLTYEQLADFASKCSYSLEEAAGTIELLNEAIAAAPSAKGVA